MSAALRSIIAPNASAMTLDGTHTFIVGKRRPLVIDPGPSDDAHIDAIVAALNGAVPEAILLTHAHADHASGALPLRDRCGAPMRMTQGALSLPFPEREIDSWLADGELIESDVGPVEVVATPGHTPASTSFRWRSPEGGAHADCWFVGDLLMGAGDTTLVAAPEGVLADYFASLDRVEAAAPTIIYPAHGPPITEPSATITRYRRHRANRIAQVGAALQRHGSVAPERLVPDVYGTALQPALRHAAAASVAAIIHYLTRSEPELVAPTAPNWNTA